MKTFLSQTFLDSHKILEKYFHRGQLNDNDLQNYLFVEAHNKDPYKPDYIFKNAMEDFTQGKSTNELLLSTLDELSNMLTFRDDKIYVANQQFEKWQNTILSISPLVIISFAIYKQSLLSFRVNIEDLITSIFKKSALPSIFEPQLDHMIADRGLNEMHMHLNGTTEADIVWHDALQQPKNFYTYIQKSLANSTVQEQYLQIGNFAQEDLFRLLKIAAQIRDKMIYMLDHNECAEYEHFTIECFDIGKSLCYASRNHPMSLIDDISLDSKMQYESLFLIRSFEYLASSDSTYFGYLFHYYLLIYSYFQKLLVQQKTQVGFDQFQKITVNELRELTEEHYTDRYHQLQGMHGNSLAVLEGRFAPKDDLIKSYKLLKAIRKGYNQKLQKAFELKLVPHFTKQLDTRNPERIITFRDLKQRLKNKKSLDVLLESLNYHDKKGLEVYKELVVGFDAAGNELHSSPEAFSPIFRKLAFLGYKNFTYHAGEDFIHILSGLRMVYEAVEFLEMGPGNRIGHATALGIEPSLWYQRLYDSKLTIKKGEWLDNLVFAYDFCTNNQKMYSHLAKLESTIRHYFAEIYSSDKYYSMHQIIEAWKCRKYDPFIVFNWREPGMFEDFERIELQNFQAVESDIRNLFTKYHDGQCIEKYNQMIQIEPLTVFGVNELRTIQNMMIELLNSKNMAIETLPTSNVRISYYKSYEEHHLSRWLGLANEKDPKPTVVVGSDDTGIFMTNLKNEYAHIFQTLTKKTDSHTAMEKIKVLNENSKAFTFNI